MDTETGESEPASLPYASPEVGGSAPVRTTPASAVRGGFRRGTAGFESLFNRYLHRRLRTSTSVLLIVAILLLANSLAFHLGKGWYKTLGLFDAGRVTIICGILVGLFFHRVLCRPYISGLGLRIVDAGIVLFIILASTLYYTLTWKSGPIYLVPNLGLLLLARAVIVPSRAIWTLLISLPAVPAILAVQLAHGNMYADFDLRIPDSSFLNLVAWNQVVLIVSIGLATVSSRVNFVLRRQAFEAAELGQYVLGEQIGRGAMGEVYRAHHAMLRRPTALKVIRAGIVDERTVARFELEVRQTARLTHPNTIVIYDYGRTAEGTFYYAMELLDGADLYEIVEKSGPMPAGRVIHILAQVCSALEEAHSIGLVHRDIKGGNILLCRRGLVYDFAKVMDFGLVKDTRAKDSSLTGIGEVCGTPETISPEAIQGLPIGPACDLYAVGAVGCHLLTGKPIFDALVPLAFVNLHLTAEPITPSARGAEVSPELERTLLACLAKDPGDRPSSAGAVREMLLAAPESGNWTVPDAVAWWKQWEAVEEKRKVTEAAEGSPSP